MIRLLKSVTKRNLKSCQKENRVMYTRTQIRMTMQAVQHILKAQPEKFGAVNPQF